MSSPPEPGLRKRGGGTPSPQGVDEGWVKVKKISDEKDDVAISEGLREALAKGYSASDLKRMRKQLLEKRVQEETAEAMIRQQEAEQHEVENMFMGCIVIVVLLGLVYLVFRFGPVMLAARRGEQVPGVHPKLTDAMKEMRQYLGPVGNFLRL